MAENGTLNKMNDSNNASSTSEAVEQSIPEKGTVSNTELSMNKGLTKMMSNENDTNALQDEVEVECGWGALRPKMLQYFNRPMWFLICLSMFAITQGITVNGLVYVVTTTLERRFQLPSAKSGSISSAYDFSVMVVIIFVTYFGETRHKPKLLAIGALIFAVGSFMFTLPHYLTPFYDASAGQNELCMVNGTTSTPSTDDSVSNFFWVFVAAQFLHGLGASPLYTLGVTYIDENVQSKHTGLYIGIFNGASLLGPAIGYLLGGLLLDLYTDLRVDMNELGFDNDNPIFIGAWWMGFLLTCFLALCLVMPFLAFPKALPGSKQLAQERVSEAHGGSNFEARAGFGAGLMDFPKACFDLIKNIPFMCICGSAASEWFLLSGFAVFAPKFLESQFSLSSSRAAILVGVLVIMAGVGGSILGGYVVKRFSLKYKGMIRFCLGAIFASFLLLCAFFISCPDPKFAGVTVYYNKSTISDQKCDDLYDVCNMKCGCGDRFQPVCGADDVVYYSPCHAGCDEKETSKDGSSNAQRYTNCKCIFNDSPNKNSSERMAQAGKCPSTCSSLPVFLILLFFFEFATVLAVVPSTTATLRCVSHSQRSFALGLQSLIYRAFGTVPGPIIIGLIIDQACLLKEPCDATNGSTCWLYSNGKFSTSLLILATIIKIVSLLFYLGALLFYKSPVSDVEGLAKMADSDNNQIRNHHIAPL